MSSGYYGGGQHGSHGGHRGGGGGGGYGGGGGGGGYGGGGGRQPRERRGIPLSALDPNLTAVSHKVIGAARDVHVALGSGYAESVYAEALKQEFSAQGIPFKFAHPIPVKYKDQVVGQTIADFFIDGKFILEVMAEPREVSSGDRSNLRAQLKAADLELGLIINFAGRLLKDGLVRVLNVDKIQASGNLPPDADGDHVDGEGVDFDETR